MINVIHTFQAPDQNTVLPEIRSSLQNMETVSGANPSIPDSDGRKILNF